MDGRMDLIRAFPPFSRFGFFPHSQPQAFCFFHLPTYIAVNGIDIYRLIGLPGLLLDDHDEGTVPT